MSTYWTVHQLVEIVRLALHMVGYEGQDSRRVRDVPDVRTIRYYTTIGLVDRPTEYRGRTGYYGRKQVLQLVAIKRLQCRGLSLVEVQRAIAGADEALLARLAGLPNDFWERLEQAGKARLGPDSRSEPPEAKASDRGQFWASVPSLPTSVEQPRMPPAVTAQPAVSFQIAQGIRVIVEGLDLERVPAETLEELQSALARLVHVLRRLLRNRGEAFFAESFEEKDLPGGGGELAKVAAARRSADSGPGTSAAQVPPKEEDKAPK